MSKYIDAEKLITEIERLKERAQAERVLYPKTILSAKDYLLIQDYNSLLQFITSLQQEQPEVDLEKEIVSICETYGITKNFDAELGPLDIKNIAHHFYNRAIEYVRKECEKRIAEGCSKEGVLALESLLDSLTN